MREKAWMVFQRYNYFVVIKSHSLSEAWFSLKEFQISWFERAARILQLSTCNRNEPLLLLTKIDALRVFSSLCKSRCFFLRCSHSQYAEVYMVFIGLYGLHRQQRKKYVLISRKRNANKLTFQVTSIFRSSVLQFCTASKSTRFERDSECTLYNCAQQFIWCSSARLRKGRSRK